MLGRLDVSIDCYPPSLIPDDLDITVQDVHHGREFWPKDEDIHSTVLSKGVQRIGNLFDEHTSLGINNETVFNIDRGRAL
jgi:hypothetical protein